MTVRRPAERGGLTPEQRAALVELWRGSNRRSVIPVTGGSMFPALRAGWELVVDHGTAAPPFGSLIVFLDQGLLVAHRVVGRTAAGHSLTKGDALIYMDRRPVPPERILGRVVALRRRPGEEPVPVRRSGEIVMGIFSRLIGDLNRAARPVRQSIYSGNPILRRLPGPTRVLRRLNRGVVRWLGDLS